MKAFLKFWSPQSFSDSNRRVRTGRFNASKAPWRVWKVTNLNSLPWLFKLLQNLSMNNEWWCLTSGNPFELCGALKAAVAVLLSKGLVRRSRSEAAQKITRDSWKNMENWTLNFHGQITICLLYYETRINGKTKSQIRNVNKPSKFRGQPNWIEAGNPKTRR